LTSPIVYTRKTPLIRGAFKKFVDWYIDWRYTFIVSQVIVPSIATILQYLLLRRVSLLCRCGPLLQAD